MKLSLGVGAALTALLLLQFQAVFVSALHVEQRATPRIAQSTHEDERFEQSFIVRGDGDDTRVSSITSNGYFQVYVSSSSSEAPTHDTLATVRVIGDSEAIVNNAAVTAGGTGEIVVDGPSFNNQRGSISGRMRVEIDVHAAEQVRTICNTGSGDIIVEDRALITNQPAENMTIALTGSGSVYLPPRLRFTGSALVLSIIGSGSIHLNASDISTQLVDVVHFGNSDVKLVAASLNVTSAMSISAFASGSLKTYASAWTVHTLSLSQEGNGDVKLQGASSVIDKCVIASRSSADICMGSLLCTDAIVTLVGSGDITAHIVRDVSYMVVGSGDVYLAGAPPPQREERMPGSRRAHKKTSTTPPDTAWIGHYAPPKAGLTYVAIGEHYESDIDVAVEEDGDEDTAQPATSPGTPTQAPPSTDGSYNSSVVYVIGAFACFFVALNAVSKWWSRLQDRREHVPLIHNEDDRPVYI